MDEKIERLLKIELFCQLDQEHLFQIGELFQEVSYNRDGVIVHQGQVVEKFYILVKGEALIWRMQVDGVEQVMQQLEPGDWFGINALFLEEISDVALHVSGGSIIYELSRSDFEQYLQKYPDVWHLLLVPESLAHQLAAPQFDWMTGDEITVFFAVKTHWALVGKLILPVALSILLLWFSFRSIGGPIDKAPLLWVLLAFLVGGGLSVLRWLDWRNDYYVVTNKRVVHHESHLPTLKVTVEQALLHQIQNVTLLKPSPLAQALNYGSIIIETAGRGGVIAFTLLDDPDQCQQIIFHWLEKTQSLEQINERAAIRAAITQQLGSGVPSQTARIDDAPESKQAPVDNSDLESASPNYKEISWLERILGRFAARINELLPNFRLEVGQVITWRKHPFVLFRAIWAPVLVMLATVFVSIGWNIATDGQNYSDIVLPLFIVCVLESFWFMWRYEDWRNDLFQMTASHILDIDRLPLGLKESRRQASLDQIQNINVDIPNIWARIFNYGNVIIETAGRRGDLTFEWVMRPRTIQAEIFARIEELRDNSRKEKTRQRRQEMVNWLSVYHEMKEKKEI